MIVGERLARRLSAATFEAAVGESLRSQSVHAANAMRDLQELRQFISSGPVALPIDAAFAPIFLLGADPAAPGLCGGRGDRRR